MRLFQIVILVFIIGCGRSQESQNSLSDNSVENFVVFYKRFYSDEAFQQTRLLIPLEGKIKSWDEDEIKEETWEGRNIVISSKDVYLESYPNLKTEILELDSSYVEKYWLEQSGFLIRREFVQRNGKWYLMRYDISNI
jgi:hypothetical protein